MKKFRCLALVMCLLLLLQFTALPVAATTEEPDEPTPAATQPEASQIPEDTEYDAADITVLNGCHSPDARYPINGSDEILSYTDSAILYEVSSDTLVYTYNEDEQLHPSSLVKIMTALLAFEYADMDDVVVCRAAALDQVAMGALVAYLNDGEELTLEQLLYVMLVGSCNDAAVVIADHISGSQEAFVDLMNRRAAELGCTDTVFKNATGLHDDDQVSTCRDMVRILREVMKYPKFMEIFGTPNYTLPETNRAEARYFVTTNYMISDERYLYYVDSRVTGGRTGSMNNGDYCLAVTADINGGAYIAIVMGTKEYFAIEGQQPLSHASFVDVSTMLNLASRSSLVQVVNPDQIVDQMPVQGGEYHVVVGSQETVSCVLPPDYSWDQISMRTELVNNSLNAPVKAGTKVANVQFWYDNICIAETELFTMIDVPVSASASASTDVVDEGGFDAGALSTALMVLGVIFAVILLIFGGLFLVRTVRVAMRSARIKKRRQERRRSK